MSERPILPLSQYMSALADLPDLQPMERARAAARLQDDGRRLLAVGQAQRPLLREALLLILRPGVCSARREQLAQGLADSAPIAVMARRVLFGSRNVMPHALADDEAQLMAHAIQLAESVLSNGSGPADDAKISAL